MIEKYTEQDKPLYMWKYNATDGSVSKKKIVIYKVRQYPMYTYYLFKINGSNVNSVRNAQLDRFLHDRVYSFDNDDEKARKIIESSLLSKYNKAKKDFDIASQKLELFRSKN